jgi:hypothetical protein
MSNLIDDIFTVLRPLWFIALFQVLVGFAIISLPEVQDVILIILEDTSLYHWSPLTCFTIALLFWSITSEFGSRFILYLSDISSHNLNPDRVQQRKDIAKVYSTIVLFFPIFITSIGFIIVYFTTEQKLGLAPVAALVSLMLLLAIIWLCYYGPRKNYFSLYRRLNPDSQRILIQLTGILQVRYIPICVDSERLSFDTISADGKFVIRKPTIKDFKPLFCQFYFFLLIAVIGIIVFLYLPNQGYVAIGSLAIISSAFACWLTIYYAIEMLDTVQPFKLKLPYKPAVIATLIICSCQDNDHPVWAEELKVDEALAKRPILTEHFESWRENLNPNDSSKSPLPVVFVAAEGGASRTGFFTAMMLAKLKEQYPTIIPHIYAYSSVSGGTLGVNLFNALLLNNPICFPDSTLNFFNEDFLAPATGKLAFGEITNYFWPTRIQSMDREYALERSWEIGYCKMFKNKNVFSRPFDSLYVTDKQVHPALFIHSTQVESGQRAIYSNVEIDSSTFPKALDLYSITKAHLRYSSVIGLSTRFPLVSPAGVLVNCMPYHYVDGGYFENRGATTLADAIKKLKCTSKVPIKPYVIVFAFGDDTPTKGKTRVADELISIISGIYNVRSGHTDHATELLKREVDQNNFIKISPTKDIPMNWVFSSEVMDEVSKHCDTLLVKHKDFFDKLKRDIK